MSVKKRMHSQKIADELERQLLSLEERGCRQPFMKKARELLVRGGAVEEDVCLVIPFGCLSIGRAMAMIGSGKQMFSRVDQVFRRAGVCKEKEHQKAPYILQGVRVEKTADNQKNRRFLTFNEMLFWMVFHPESSASFVPAVGGGWIGIVKLNQKDPEIILESRFPGTTLSCLR